ncbi:MAG: hypothetical protein ACOYEV_15650 [Candidatus Nanopelagicales bacterium]
MKFGFIAGEEGNYPVSRMCVWAKVSRSGYYDWKSRGPSARALRREALGALVADSFERSDEIYGYRARHGSIGPVQPAYLSGGGG